ncbi:F-box/kelch-repeat protein At3g06240-like [Rhodamnia argentea]|uniref:F-box/kelch-repeat protein At3g06240-like n=1 Tax=Rhodamnia argentea TaxID=178133 RepID=A0A8B8QUR5_9MYRT|nr:F-box/kelch-repeat protein At3g06240-like [Rhodamnia argentea]
MAESFPEDIWVEIFFRLPVKSLMLFKCVCRRWQSLISDPGFAKSHLQRLKAGDLIPSQRIIKSHLLGQPLMTIDFEALEGAISDGRDCEPVELHCPHSPHKDYSFWNDSFIVGSCDGLICVFVRKRFLIYNPATRIYRELPGSDFVGEIYLSDEFVGFGYDSRSDDYKIVGGFVDYGNWEVEIFSLKSGCWRSIQVPFQEESHLKVSGPGVYWNGGIHWFVDYRVAHRRQGVIMSFDLSEEKFHRELPVPEVNVDIVLVGIGIHGASLFIYNSRNDSRVEAWIMDEHRKGGSWTKWLSFCMHPPVVAPMAYTRSGKIVLRMDMFMVCMNIRNLRPKEVKLIYRMNMDEIEDMERMVLFNPEDRSWEAYPIEGELIEHAIYLESLISPYLGIDPSRM